MLNASIFPKGQQRVYDHEHDPNFPIVLELGQADANVNVFMAYAEAIALASALRVACGVEEPKTEEAA